MTLEFGDDNDTMFSSPMIRNSACIELMVVHVSITGRMSVLQTVVLLKDIVLLHGGNVMVWERIAYGRQTPLNVIHGNTVH